MVPVRRSALANKNLDSLFARLESQLSRAEAVLLTGAGFSLSAKDSEGKSIPSSAQLSEEIWDIAFPGDNFPEGVDLGDAFHSARTLNPKGLRELIHRRLTVNSHDLPELYRTWFSLPWFKCYTLNVDDMETAVNHRYSLRRGISSLSATSGRLEGGTADSGSLEVVHLNGAVWDGLEHLTFTRIDYSRRRAGLDAIYRQCVTDIVSRPVVFVGTDLNESILWDYLALRGEKGVRGLRELRPGSLLVGPSLNRAKQVLLRELHVDWIQMTAEEFAEEFLKRFSPHKLEQGFSSLDMRRDSERRSRYPQLVSEIASSTIDKKTEYLMGQEPEWSDLQSGRAILRESDNAISSTALKILRSSEPQPPLSVTGTAGSGKSTSLMRLALTISGLGIPTYWIDERTNIDVYRVRDLVVANESPLAIMVDDADVFGRAASRWATELSMIRGKVLVAFAVRSSKVDAVFENARDSGISPTEFAMPHLSDSDIGALVDVLDRENRLGVLKGKSSKERFQAFRQQAGRQLLVAMIQATSGELFDHKAVQEFVELSATQKTLYAIICFVHSQRFSLDREELLTATNSHDNKTLNELELLVKRGLVTRYNLYSGYKARHRVVAERVVNSQEFRSNAYMIVEGICAAFATRLSDDANRTSRNWRRLIKFINHEFILLFCSVEDGRSVYQNVEGLLHWDYHYWLQRGALEVEEGDLNLATNYLGQARSLAPYDQYVETEWAYLLMKKAAQWPKHTDAREWFREGFSTLKSLTESRGTKDPHPYHILGSQTISWSRSAQLSILEIRGLLGETVDILEKGRKQHPRRQELRKLYEDVKREWLNTVVVTSSKEREKDSLV